MTERDTPKYLKSLRDEFSDEIPKNILNGLSPQLNFKVRRNWWNGLIGRLQTSIIYGEITDPEIIKEVETFIDHYISDRFKKSPLTTSEDITEANRIINLVLRRGEGEI